jgi:hypothetical protein
MKTEEEKQKIKEEDSKRFEEEFEFLQKIKKMNDENKEKNSEWDNWKPTKDIK